MHSTFSSAVRGVHQLQGDHADIPLWPLRRLPQVLHQDHPDDSGAKGLTAQVSQCVSSSIGRAVGQSVICQLVLSRSIATSLYLNPSIWRIKAIYHS